MNRLLAACLPVLAFAIAARAEVRPDVRLDPRVELSAALHVLSSSASAAGFRDDGSPYAKALLDGLRARPAHPVTAAYARAARRSGAHTFMAPLRELVLCLDDSLALLSEPEECRRSGLAHAAADFARETGFGERLAAAARTVQPALESLRAERDAADLVGLFEKYSSAKASSHRVAPSPLLASGQVWNGMERPSPGSYWVVTAISPVSVSTSGPVFDWQPVMRDVWHEHSHGLMDPAMDALEADLGASAGLFTLAEASQCYGSWKQCVREHVAQGTSARILEWARGGGKLQTTLEPVLNPKLPWESLIVARLAEYEADRRRYPTLASFAPRLMAVFREEAARRGLKPLAQTAALQPETDPDVQRGLDLFAAGKPAAAAAAFETAIQRSSGPASTYMSLFVALDAAGRSAGPALDKAIELARADAAAPAELLADALSSRASLRERADKAGAREDLEEALVTAPLDWPRRAEAKRRLASLKKN